MLYTGLATSEELLVKRPDVVRRFIRATVKGREFLKRYKTQSLALGKKYDRSPDDVRNADYDATMEMMTADGTEDLETQKSDIDIGRRALGDSKGNTARSRYSIFVWCRKFTKSCGRGLGPGAEGEQDNRSLPWKLAYYCIRGRSSGKKTRRKVSNSLWSDAAQAEEIGFDHIWLGDSVTVLDKARGDCLTTMAALAARTNTIRIGAVPMLPALRNPVLLAHALATLDVISKGRIILGVSVGPVRDYIQRQFAACGVPPQEKAGRLSESIEIMRRLWSEKTINYDGRYYKLNDVGILPHPAQKPGIPIWIVADRNENGFKRVGRLGDGWVTLAPTLEQIYRGAAARSINMLGSTSRVGKVSGELLCMRRSIFKPTATARADEGWQWMEQFFRATQEKSSVTISRSSARRMNVCVC